MYATSINPVAAAAHHVMLSIFLFFATVGDAVSQAAQSFLPAVVLTARLPPFSPLLVLFLLGYSSTHLKDTR